MQKIIKPLLILIALIGLAAIVYIFVIKQQDTAPEGSLTRSTATGTQIPLAPTATTQANVNVAQDVEKFKKLLDQLKVIKLNDSLFENSQYQNLTDNTALALQELDRIKNGSTLGKDNPFLGFDGVVPNIVLQGSAATPISNPRVAPRR